MKTLFGLKYLSVIILCLCATLQNARDVSYKEVKQEPLNRYVKNILIIGIGSTASRIFLDNLSDKLIQLLKNKHIESSYQYLGKNNEEARKNYSLLEFKGNDALLVISSSDSSFFEIDNKSMTIPTYNPVFGTVGINTYTGTPMYNQG